MHLDLAAKREHKAALQGVRVLELGLAWAGPLGTMLLASFGVEVIKIESRARPDFSRRFFGHEDLDLSPNFQDVNLNKLSVLLNLKSEAAVEIVLRLVCQSDVVMTSMRPGVMEKLGLGYDTVRRIRPDIVYVSASASGTTGPESAYAGFAPTFAALGGMSHLTGFASRPPAPLSMATDIRCAYTVALATLLALHHRRRTGRGQFVDLSFVEAVAALAPHTFVEYVLTSHVASRTGNRDEHHAPQGCYRCRDNGWISISIHTEPEWHAFCQAVGHPEWRGEPRFQDTADRVRHHDELDELIEQWTSSRTAQECMQHLQEVGVAAVPIFTPDDLWNDRHLREREAYKIVLHPKLGRRVVLNMPWRLSRTPSRIVRPGPLLGEHTDLVLHDLLGLAPEQIQALKDRQVIY